ncbi:MAG: DUF3108 domain-containing protein [Acidobacteriota bacterium]
MRGVLIALLLIATVASAAEPVDQLFVKGETLDYTLTWLGISGGSARFTIGLAPGAPDRFRITSIARSSSGFARIFRVRDEIQSFVDRELFTTIGYEKHLNERGKKKDDLTIVDREKGISIRRRPGKLDQVVPVDGPLFDPLSLIYQFRRLDLRPGNHVHFMVVADGKLYAVDADVTQRETLTTPVGTFRTIAIEPQMSAGGLFRDEDSRLTIWYSDDERRLPLRIRSDVKVGSITATLRSVRAGVTGIEPNSK